MYLYTQTHFMTRQEIFSTSYLQEHNDLPNIFSTILHKDDSSRYLPVSYIT